MVDLPAPLPALCCTIPIVRGPKGQPIPQHKFKHLAPGTHIQGPPGCEYVLTTGNEFFVVDLDCKRAGIDGHESLEALEREHGETLPDTYITETRNGGTHLYFRIPKTTIIRSQTGFRPGIDIRGAPNGLVVAYPSPNPGQPIAEAPKWFLALLRQGTPGARLDIPLEDPIEKTREDLLTDLRGKRGPYADALRKAAGAERFVRAAGSDKGPKRAQGVDDFITSMLAYLAHLGDWCHVKGEHVMALLRPAFSLLEDDDRTQGNEVYDLDKWVRSFDRASLHARAEIAADNALRKALDLAEEEATIAPKVLQFRQSYYLQDPDIGYAGPYQFGELWSQARDRDVFPVVKPTKNGGTARLSPQDMMEMFGQGGALNAVVQDLSIQNAILEDGGTLRAACCVRPHIEAAFNPHIDKWLHALGGDVLIDWLSILTELQEAAPALWLAGAKGVGKSLLARGCAQIYGRANPVSMTKAMGRFNDAIAECPIVFGDEEVPRDYRGEPQLDILKQIITDTARDIETKGMPVVPLRGAIRVILASNNMNLIHTSRHLTPQDAEALQDRFVHIEVRDEVRSTLEGFEIQKEWIDGGALARHLTWILENHERPKRDRLRMPAYADKLGAMLLTQAGDAFFVCRAICFWLTGESNIQWGTPGCYLQDGEVYVTVRGLKNLLRQMDDTVHVNDRQLSETLSKISEGKKSLRTEAGPVRVDHIRWDALTEWAQRDGWVQVDKLEEARKK